MKKIITVILAVALVLALAAPAIADAFTLYVTQSGVKVYAKKSTDSKVYRRLSKGERVLIEQKSGNWYAILVEDPTGGQMLGWIQAKYLSTTKPSKEKKKATKAPVVTVSPQKEINRVLDTMRSVTPYEAEVVTRTENGTVAFRRQPTTSGALIRQVVNGSRLQVLAEGDGWNQVSDPQTGTIGFMSSKYLVERSQVANDEQDEAGVYEDEADVPAASVAAEGRTVAPIGVSLDVNKLPDGDYPVSFDRGDVASLHSGIYMNAVHIYTMDLYSADAMRALAVGDTVVVEGRAIPVNSVEENGGFIEVNGLDADGGYRFAPQSGGLYRVYGDDDLATYTELGVTTLVVDGNAVYTDDSDIDGQPVAARGEAIVSALHGAALDAFYADNTTVTLKDGRVVRIERRYVP